MDTKKLRQKILDLAIHGKLVPQDPNDEPASVLLERIRKEKEQLIKEGKIKAPKKGKSAGDTSHYPKEGPWELPEGWCWCKIGDIAIVARGGSPRPIENYLTTDSSGVNWIKIGDAEQGGKYINSTKQRITHDGVSRSRIVHAGDFLLTNSMSFGRPYILNIEGCIHDGWLVISPLQGVINKDFFFYLLSSDFAYQQFSEQASGAVVSNLNKDKVAEAYIPLPPVREQAIIVKAIEAIDLRIEKIEHEQCSLFTTLSFSKGKILDLAIHGKLVPQDPSDEPAIELLKRINPDFKPSDNLHYGDIPQSWTVCKLSDVCTDFIVPQRDKPKLFDGDVPWCRIEDIEGKYLNGSLSGRLVSKKTIQQMNMRICPVGTVICSCSASIGTQAIVTRPCCTNQTFIGFVPNERFIYNEFLYYFLASQTQQFQDIGTGTTIKYISREKFEEYMIPLPPLAEQRRIVERIEHYLLLLKQIKSATSTC